MWIWLVLLYGLLKGCREVCKKKALQTSPSIEVLLIYTCVSFLLVVPDAGNAMGMEAKFYFFVALKSLIIFLAWILSFSAIKHLPLSMYGVLDLSRVLFATLLGLTVLGEHMGTLHIIGLSLVCAGLLMLKFKPMSPAHSPNSVPKEIIKKERKYSAGIVIIALISCMLNSLSGLMDKILTRYITSSQLQFWYMLFLCLFYILYALAVRENISIKRAVRNKWIWLLAVMFVIADRALFIANADPASKVTVMTLIKQAGAIVTILAGKFIFKEKNVGHKLICAGVIIVGIMLSVF
ncbi:MAG: EamA family transporter [Lachnospiraceae bacterium]|nr:EamA family transporter [Lachnospiraceae bacterium]